MKDGKLVGKIIRVGGRGKEEKVVVG